MNDAYIEWLVKRRDPWYSLLVKVTIGFLILVGILLSGIPLFGFIFLLLAFAAGYFILPLLKVEYEYLVVNEQITIDKIYGKSRRKKAWEGSLDDLEIVAPVGSDALRDAEKQGEKVLDFTSNYPGAKVYGMIQMRPSGALKILIEPNEKIIEQLWLRAPRKVVK